MASDGWPTTVRGTALEIVTGAAGFDGAAPQANAIAVEANTTMAAAALRMTTATVRASRGCDALHATPKFGVVVKVERRWSFGPKNETDRIRLSTELPRFRWNRELSEFVQQRGFCDCIQLLVQPYVGLNNSD